MRSSTHRPLGDFLDICCAVMWINNGFANFEAHWWITLSSIDFTQFYHCDLATSATNFTPRRKRGGGGQARILARTLAESYPAPEINLYPNPRTVSRACGFPDRPRIFDRIRLTWTSSAFESPM